MSTSPWQLVGGPGARRDNPEARWLWTEAVSAAPSDYAQDLSTVMLPLRQVTGRCRLCGQNDLLTKEHIPPKASGNRERTFPHTFQDWLQQTNLDHLGGRPRVQQGGIYGHTLCRSCNSLTGTRYGPEYKRWVDLVKVVMASFPAPAYLDQLDEPLGWPLVLGDPRDGGLRPGALVRQVLSCMCSLSGTWDLAGRHPAVRRIILEGACESLPDNCELGMTLFLGPRARLLGPQLKIDPAAHSWQWLMEMAFPPFSFLLQIASNTMDADIGLRIGNFTLQDADTAGVFEGLTRIGFGWSPYPGDYRSRASLEAGVA